MPYKIFNIYREANFLRMIDRKAPLLYEPDVVNQAIRRYETYWLPMQAAHPDMNVIPPLDVHWVWHTHMLSPIHYQEDCEAICGSVIDHKLLSSDEIQKSTLSTFFLTKRIHMYVLFIYTSLFSGIPSPLHINKIPL
uniref:DUF309 domain-containing protein n=1 Tax=Heterorhabditis bacteriophora TaxID=37862 RepID=A0A1I7X1F0_HETBA